MLEFIVSFFDMVVSLLKLLFQYICDLPVFLKTLVEIVAVFPSYLFFLPDTLITAFGMMTAFALLYKFIGREG